MIGIGLIIVVGVELELLPTQGYVSFQGDPVGSIKSTLLPAITLGIGVAAATMRILRPRSSTSAPRRSSERRRGRGCRRRRSSRGTSSRTRRSRRSPPAGIIVAHLVGGAVIVEYVFARPGLGTLLVDSVFQRDYGVLQTLVLIAAAAFIVTSLVVDVILGVIDPRLRTKAVT